MPAINLVDTDGGSNWKLIDDGGELVLQNGTANVVVIQDGSLANALSSIRAAWPVVEPHGQDGHRTGGFRGPPDQLAELPLYTWSYTDDSSQTVHVGPMAEDFHHRFGFGSDEKRLSSIDTGGLALAAIQGLRQEGQEKDLRIQALELRLEELERLIADPQ